MLGTNTVMLAIICSFSCKWEQNGAAADLCLKNSTMLQFCVCESAQDPQQNISLQSWEPLWKLIDCCCCCCCMLCIVSCGVHVEHVVKSHHNSNCTLLMCLCVCVCVVLTVLFFETSSPAHYMHVISYVMPTIKPANNIIILLLDICVMHMQNVVVGGWEGRPCLLWKTSSLHEVPPSFSPFHNQKIYSQWIIYVQFRVFTATARTTHNYRHTQAKGMRLMWFNKRNKAKTETEKPKYKTFCAQGEIIVRKSNALWKRGLVIAHF